MRRNESKTHPCLDQYPMLMRSARQLARGDEHCAEDLVQEVMLRALVSPSSIQAPERWSRTVLRNLVRKSWAKCGQRTESLEALELQPPSANAPENTELEPSEQSLLAEALDRLPDKFRTPIECTYLRGLSIRETAQRLGVPYRTVLSRRARGLARLRGAIPFGWGPSPE